MNTRDKILKPVLDILQSSSNSLSDKSQSSVNSLSDKSQSSVISTQSMSIALVSYLISFISGGATRPLSLTLFVVQCNASILACSNSIIKCNASILACGNSIIKCNASILACRFLFFCLYVPYESLCKVIKRRITPKGLNLNNPRCNRGKNTQPYPTPKGLNVNHNSIIIFTNLNQTNQ